MALYDKNGIELDLSKFYDSNVAGDRKQEIQNGKKTVKAIFYEDGNNTLLKAFTMNNVGNKIIGDRYITEKEFDILKSIDNPNIVKLLNYYYTDKNIPHFGIDAYTMEKVHSKKMDIIGEDKNILLCYLSDLNKLAKVLANKRICMQDTNGANLLFNSTGPVVVDLDFYYKKNLGFKSDIEKGNKKAVLSYLKNYAINNYLNLYDDEDKDEFTRKLNDLYGVFAVNVSNSNIDIVKAVDNNIQEYNIAKQLKIKRTK